MVAVVSGDAGDTLFTIRAVVLSEERKGRRSGVKMIVVETV